MSFPQLAGKHFSKFLRSKEDAELASAQTAVVNFSRADMKQPSQFAGRNFILALMLLLAVAASLVSFSYDADTQDDIPPVTVELKFLPQAPTATQSTARAPLGLTPAVSVGLVFKSRVLSPSNNPDQVPQSSPQLSPTLRC